MTIDVSKLKEGDVVLIEMKVMRNDVKNEQIAFFDDPYHHRLFTYRQLGGAIKEIIPAPFDWKDVKPGMAFYHREHDCIYIFESFSVFPSSSGDRAALVSPLHCRSEPGANIAVRALPDELLRASEYDIEVPE